MHLVMCFAQGSEIRHHTISLFLGEGDQYERAIYRLIGRFLSNLTHIILTRSEKGTVSIFVSDTAAGSVSDYVNGYFC